ncbi:MAG TPA: AAA family ATPase [Actinomycetota bacterium]|nr:AAA family ATPase [Actinomycetota bacterium]
MKYRRQPLHGPRMESLAHAGGEAAALAPRAPEVPLAPVDGIFKLHPLASRVAYATRHFEDPDTEPVPPFAAEPEPHPDSEARPVVRLVSSWPAEPDGEQEDYEEEPEEVPLPDAESPAAEAGRNADTIFGSSPAEGVEDSVEPARMTKVVVVDRVGKLARDVEKVAHALDPSPKVIVLTRPTELLEVVEEEDPDVLVVSPEEMTAAGLKRLAQAHRAQARVVILLSDTDKTWSAAQIAAAGASDFLPANLSRPKLKAKLTDALKTASELRVENVVVTERIVVHEAAPLQPLGSAAAQQRGRVFTVASPTGGSGKTMVATNFAAYLAKTQGAKVLLIDLDLQFGNVAPTLHLHPQRTIGDLADDPSDLPELVVEHSLGFKTLCAPADPLESENISPDQVSGILEAARKHFDFVVVDTPPMLNETCLVAFDQSEKVVVLANMDVPSLKNMRRYVEAIANLGVVEDQCVLIVNRSDTGIGLELKGITQLFPKGFLTVLPTAKDVPWSTNMGTPILQANPKAEISRQLREGFKKLVPPPGIEPDEQKGEPGRKAGLLGRKKGKS